MAKNFVPSCPEVRLHIVEGLLKAINVIDQVIALIRASDDAAAAEIEEFKAEYRERFANPYVAAEMGYLDDVIEHEFGEEGPEQDPPPFHARC
mgnify:CR=1 FL=1